MLAGAALRIYTIRLLGKSFTFDVATREGQTIAKMAIPADPPSVVHRGAYVSRGSWTCAWQLAERAGRYLRGVRRLRLPSPCRGTRSLRAPWLSLQGLHGSDQQVHSIHYLRDLRSDCRSRSIAPLVSRNHRLENPQRAFWLCKNGRVDERETELRTIARNDVWLVNHPKPCVIGLTTSNLRCGRSHGYRTARTRSSCRELCRGKGQIADAVEGRTSPVKAGLVASSCS